MKDQAIQRDENWNYISGRRLYPGVTNILKAEGIIDDTWYNEEATYRGEMVHKITELIDKGKGDCFLDSEIFKDLEPYTQAYQRFLNENKIDYFEIETKFVNETYGLGGTPDRIGTLNLKGTLIDIKTGNPEKWHGIQLAAYALLIADPKIKKFGLYLKPNGKYKFEPYNDTKYLDLFLSALTLYKWKENK